MRRNRKLICIGYIMLALTIVSGYTSINAVVKAEFFPVEIRTLGVGLPYGVTVSVFGGTAEYIAFWFKAQGMESGFYWYVTACIACSLIVYIFLLDTSQSSIIDKSEGRTVSNSKVSKISQKLRTGLRRSSKKTANS